MTKKSDRIDDVLSSHSVSTDDHIQLDVLNSNIEKKEITKSDSIFLYFCVMIACMVSSVKFGFSVVWISPVAKQLLSDNPDVNPLGASISTVHLSFLSALPGLSSLVGALILGRMFDVYGRKRAMIMIGLLIPFLEIFVIFASNILMIYIPVCILTFLQGGLMVGGRVYLAEISEDHNRSKFVCIGVLGMPLGTLCCFLIGSCDLSFQMFTLGCSVPFVVSLGCLMIFLPESPVYLIANKKTGEALGALRTLRLKGTDGLHEELEHISYTLGETSKSTGVGLTAILRDKPSRRALFLCFIIHTVTSAGGAPTIITHQEFIFDQSGSTIPSYICNNALPIVQLLFYFIATRVSEIFGRRTLLLYSSLCNALSLFSVAVYFHLKSLNFAYTEYISWWPLFGLIIVFISNSLGLGSVCWVISSEVFSIDTLSTATSLLGSSNPLVSCLGVFSFPIITEVYGMQWNFLFNAMVCLLGHIFVFFKVPETRGRSLIEIQAILKE